MRRASPSAGETASAVAHRTGFGPADAAWTRPLRGDRPVGVVARAAVGSADPGRADRAGPGQRGWRPATPCPVLAPAPRRRPAGEALPVIRVPDWRSCAVLGGFCGAQPRLPPLHPTDPTGDIRRLPDPALVGGVARVVAGGTVTDVDPPADVDHAAEEDDRRPVRPGEPRCPVLVPRARSHRVACTAEASDRAEPGRAAPGWASPLSGRVSPELVTGAVASAAGGALIRSRPIRSGGADRARVRSVAAGRIGGAGRGRTRPDRPIQLGKTARRRRSARACRESAR